MLPMPSLLEQYRKYIEPTKTPFICIETHADKATDLQSSKLGGIPYWPEGKEYPLLEQDQAKLIAQINFSELKAKGITLPDFPENGMLQFFCAVGDDLGGMNFDNLEDGNIRVIYHPDLSRPQISHPQLCDEIKAVSDDYVGMSFNEELSLSFELKEEYLGIHDECAHSRFDYKFLDNLNDDEADEFYDYADNCGSKVGGYAFFTQSDSRDVTQDWVLLLQLDSDAHIMWGDCGVANWFIRREDLIARQFNRILFTWDCC